LTHSSESFIIIFVTKRLQVLLEEEELREIQRAARRQRVTVAEWVRTALRAARQEEPVRRAERKLEALRQATRHSFPSGDIESMLAEIERGYSAETVESAAHGKRRGG
jgi:predicted ATPase